MHFLALLSPKIWIAVAIAIALAGSHWKAYRSGDKSGATRVQAVFDAYIAKRTSEALEAEAAARAREVDLQAKADKQRGISNARIRSLDLELAESLRRLRNRPERPAPGDVPTVAGVGDRGPGCTGARLFRSDGEFLVGLAADANRLRIGLAACQAAYGAARALTP